MYESFSIHSVSRPQSVRPFNRDQPFSAIPLSRLTAIRNSSPSPTTVMAHLPSATQFNQRNNRSLTPSPLSILQTKEAVDGGTFVVDAGSAKKKLLSRLRPEGEAQPSREERFSTESTNSTKTEPDRDAGLYP